jgi:DNA-binding NarL/FixJ family response regulator
VVVLDLDLPDGVGTEAVAELRRGNELDEAAVVVYTATDMFGEPRSESGAGETVFLTKARVAPWELEDRVLKLMDAVMGKLNGENREGALHVGA